MIPALALVQIAKLTHVARFSHGNRDITRCLLRSFFLWILVIVFHPEDLDAQTVTLAPADTPSGFLARLLINETPFPGERAWISEADTQEGQLAIVWVLRNRLWNIPRGYRQSQVAAIVTKDLIELISAGGEHGQVEGFYQDSAGKPAMSPRVVERLNHLLRIANTGTPGRFARLLEHAQQLADSFVETARNDPYEHIREIDGVAVTGRAYGWMTDQEIFNPGGNFIRITDDRRGGLGGNRFFTLRRLSPP